MKYDRIMIRGAREHNLKSVDVDIMKNTLTVISGLSGSGKSSLAFDTLFSEGQRRYVESLSSYARQFMGMMAKPDVDSIEGLTPAISIEQKKTSHNPRSTIGTVTEIHDHLRLLFARAGKPHCYKCGRVITRQSVQDICDTILEYPGKTKFQILSPCVVQRKGEYTSLFEKLKKQGFIRVRVDGDMYMLEEDIPLKKNRKHDIEIVVDRLVLKPSIKSRLTDSLETALKYSSNNTVIVDFPDREKQEVFSEDLNCPVCNIGYPKLDPNMFSFNRPSGACQTCNGLGYIMEMDPELVVPDRSLSLAQGAVEPWNSTSRANTWMRQILEGVCRHYGIDIDKPFSKLKKREADVILHGSGDQKIEIRWKGRQHSGEGRVTKKFEGVIPNLLRRYQETSSEDMRKWIERYMTNRPCHTCGGRRLRKESLSVKVGDKNIGEVAEMSCSSLIGFLKSLKFTGREKKITQQLLKETVDRVMFLNNVGLSYITLDRRVSTLSGGEAQRIQLATQIGSRLSGVTYILDEPSIGLHQKDNNRLINTLFSLKNLGNTVVVVEHDRDMLLSADRIIDIGPGAGVEGGYVTAEGTPLQIKKNPRSLTGQYLSGKKSIPLPEKRRKGDKGVITLKGAEGNNLKSVDFRLPLNTLTCVTGVSGSGKSTLVNQTLYPALARKLHKAKLSVLKYRKIENMKSIDKVIDIDQSPIGRTPRSNPATYTKTFDHIRSLFENLPESRMKGYSKGRFSFNVKGGRCETCRGDGVIKVEMHFLPDVFVECEVCKGKRYNRETLEIEYKGKNISEVLDMTVDEAMHFFRNVSAIYNRLSILSKVGLDYIHLGQQATTLSGGEAQRIKLASELSKRATGNTLYILDEPSTGLHSQDILLLMEVINELVDRGNTVIIIEHNPEIIKCADHIVDLGPDGGEGGGRVVAEGTPEEISGNRGSATGSYLKEYLS